MNDNNIAVQVEKLVKAAHRANASSAGREQGVSMRRTRGPPKRGRLAHAAEPGEYGSLAAGVDGHEVHDPGPCPA